MATKLIEKGNAVYEVTTAISGEKWTAAQEKALAKIAQNVEIKSFRKGKAPLNMVKEHVGNGQIFEEAMNIVLPEMFESVVNEHNLKPFYRPDVRPTKVSDTELEVLFTIICMPEVEIGQYKGLGIKAEEVVIKDEDVEHEISHLLEDNAELILKDENEAAVIGDTVVMDFIGYVDGKAFDGGSGKNYSLVLGSGQFIPGFEDQLVGAKAGQDVTVNVTFPEKYVESLAGKAAKFECKVHEIKAKKLPELNDEFVKGLKITDVETVDALRVHEKGLLADRLAQQAENQRFVKILNKIVETSKIKMADQVIAGETQAVEEEVKQQIQQNGITFEQYKEITGLTDEKLQEQFKSEAMTRLNQFLVMNKVAELEEIKVGKEDIEEYYQNISKQYGIDIAEVKKTLEPQENRLIQQLASQKIEKFLKENN